MWHFKKYELLFNYNLSAMHLYNKMHIGYKKGGVQNWCIETKMKNKSFLISQSLKIIIFS
jgi:hypothetical protein